MTAEAWAEKITHRPENHISVNEVKLFLIIKNYCIKITPVKVIISYMSQLQKLFEVCRLEIQNQPTDVFYIKKAVV